MRYQRERDQFIAQVTREGLPLWAALRLLREATGINRRAELACSSEAADRDRVPCPASLINGKKRAPTVDGVAPCLCDDYPAGSHAAGQHQKIPRIVLQDWHAERRIAKLLAELNAKPAKGGGYLCTCGQACARWDTRCSKCGKPDPIPAADWSFLTEGDPRGYTLRVIPPSYAKRNAGKDRHNLESIGVPCRESGLRF